MARYSVIVYHPAIHPSNRATRRLSPADIHGNRRRIKTPTRLLLTSCRTMLRARGTNNGSEMKDQWARQSCSTERGPRSRHLENISAHCSARASLGRRVPTNSPMCLKTLPMLRPLQPPPHLSGPRCDRDSAVTPGGPIAGASLEIPV